MGKLTSLFDAPAAEPAEADGRGGEAVIVLGRLRTGPVGLPDVLDLSTNPADLRAWVRELQDQGHDVWRTADADGTVRYALAGAGRVDDEPGRQAAGLMEHGR